MQLRLLGLLALSQAWLHCAPAAAKVPALFVFGDSTVDAGNNDYIPTVLRSNFAPYGRDLQGGRPTGRFCNGRLPTDFMSEAFGIKPMVPAYLDPAFGIEEFASGVCFASAGSGYDNATSDVMSVIPLWQELEHFKKYQGRLRSYLGESKANGIMSEALYVMSVGSNDFLENYYIVPGGRSAQFTVEEYQSFLVGIAEWFIGSLYRLGARKVDLTGVPPMGCLPLERTMNLLMGSSCNDDYNRGSREFNRKLEALADKLNRTLPGMRIAFANAYDALMQVLNKPTEYGFENSGVGCCATGMFEMGYLCNKKSLFTCSDPSKYVFWDAFHPTERVNRIIADYIMTKSMLQFL